MTLSNKTSETLRKEENGGHQHFPFFPHNAFYPLQKYIGCNRFFFCFQFSYWSKILLLGKELTPQLPVLNPFLNNKF